ncbi:non-homologous end-joining DNA ligase [Arthrobacter sp. E3]|uniref:non-homologous end-joining DNA ligase n=1 Tax=Arthrobacter sp. E3 TaxID=517402 RepID=UPI001A946128
MNRQDVAVDGETVTLSNPGRILYPETGTTKHDVAMYYLRAAPMLIPWAKDRPATRKRWVQGVGTAAEPGKSFFQKNLDAATPDWVQRRTMHHRDHDNDYPLVNDARTLVWLAQISALEIHVPQWRFANDGTPQNPDRLVLDLDPGEGVGLAECAAVALLARDALEQRGLRSLPVTSGSKGIHLYAGLDGKRTSDDIAHLAHCVALSLEADHPDLVVSRMGRALRRGKVFIDWSQNWPAKTTAVPYSLRGRARPTVAAPRNWDEIIPAKVDQLDYRQVLARIAGGTTPKLGDVR